VKVYGRDNILLTKKMVLAAHAIHFQAVFICVVCSQYQVIHRVREKTAPLNKML